MDARTAYLTRTEADTYFAGILRKEAWLSANDDDRDAALIEASTQIDTLAFISEKADSDQEHAFPRTGQDSVPDNVLYATCELALALLDGFDPEEEIASIHRTSDGFSGAKVTYNRDTVSQALRHGFPERAWRFLVPYLRDVNTVVLARV